MMLRLLRETLSTWSTPGVALTYFSRRQVSVFSTSFGPRPGRERADDEHRRRELGEGVDAHARRDDAGEDDEPRCRASAPRSGCAARARSRPPLLGRAAARRGRASRRRPAPPLRRDAVAVVEQRAPLGHDAACRRERRVEEEAAARLALDGDGSRVGDVALDDEERRLRCRAPTPRRAESRSRDRARRRRCATSPVVPTGIARSGSATSISKCTVRVAGSAAGARREMLADERPARSRACGCVTLRAGRDDVEVDLGRVGGQAHRARDRRPRRSTCPGRTNAPGSIVRVGDLAVERRAQDAVVDLERACSTSLAFVASELRLPRAALCGRLLLGLVRRDEAAVEQALHARRLVGDRLLLRVDARAPASATAWLAALALRQSSVASTSPRFTTAPGPHEHRVDVRRDELRADFASTHGSSVPTYVRDGRNVDALAAIDRARASRSTRARPCWSWPPRARPGCPPNARIDEDRRRRRRRDPPGTCPRRGVVRFGRGRCSAFVLVSTFTSQSFRDGAPERGARARELELAERELDLCVGAQRLGVGELDARAEPARKRASACS